MDRSITFAVFVSLYFAVIFIGMNLQLWFVTCFAESYLRFALDFAGIICCVQILSTLLRGKKDFTFNGFCLPGVKQLNGILVQEKLVFGIIFICPRKH